MQFNREDVWNRTKIAMCNVLPGETVWKMEAQMWFKKQFTWRWNVMFVGDSNQPYQK